MKILNLQYKPSGLNDSFLRHKVNGYTACHDVSGQSWCVLGMMIATQRQGNERISGTSKMALYVCFTRSKPAVHRGSKCVPDRVLEIETLLLLLVFWGSFYCPKQRLDEVVLLSLLLLYYVCCRLGIHLENVSESSLLSKLLIMNHFMMLCFSHWLYLTFVSPIFSSCFRGQWLWRLESYTLYPTAACFVEMVSISVCVCHLFPRLSVALCLFVPSQHGLCCLVSGFCETYFLPAIRQIRLSKCMTEVIAFVVRVQLDRSPFSQGCKPVYGPTSFLCTIMQKYWWHSCANLISTLYSGAVLTAFEVFEVLQKYFDYIVLWLIRIANCFIFCSSPSLCLKVNSQLCGPKL